MLDFGIAYADWCFCPCICRFAINFAVAYADWSLILLYMQTGLRFCHCICRLVLDFAIAYADWSYILLLHIQIGFRFAFAYVD